MFNLPVAAMPKAMQSVDWHVCVCQVGLLCISD